ncbi:hypothetical protein FPV67DRAFT_1446281 [Lyophyllum atratum]|nr:hypothetical protein FPV67DRAFT_1446281 [Lyophyllum atratum]
MFGRARMTVHSSRPTSQILSTHQQHQHPPDPANTADSSTPKSHTASAKRKADSPPLLGLSCDSAPFSENEMVIESDPNATPMPMPPPKELQGPHTFRPRVASLPRAKIPTALPDRFVYEDTSAAGISFAS